MATKEIIVGVSVIDGDVFFSVSAQGKKEEVIELLKEATIQVNQHPLNSEKK